MSIIEEKDGTYKAKYSASYQSGRAADKNSEEKSNFSFSVSYDDIAGDVSNVTETRKVKGENLIKKPEYFANSATKRWTSQNRFRQLIFR